MQRTQTDRSFLVLFFKKERLPSLTRLPCARMLNPLSSAKILTPQGWLD
jgi:hypothetical protein